MPVYERPETRAGSADGVRWRANLQEQVSEKVLADNVLIAPGLVNRMRHSGWP